VTVKTILDKKAIAIGAERRVLLVGRPVFSPEIGEDVEETFGALYCDDNGAPGRAAARG